MIEIELKFGIDRGMIEVLVESLEKYGFHIATKRTYEKTVMYDNKSGLMQRTDGRIRLRTSGENFELCYKKPLSRDGVKRELEYEVTVSNADTAEKILQVMEFTPSTSYERCRKTKVSARRQLDRLL